MKPFPHDEQMIDLADLAGAILSMKMPSRQIDEIVEIMLAGREVLVGVSASEVLSAKWLSSEVPCYTAGGSALSLLARRRGCRLTISSEEGGYRAVATSRQKTASASAVTEGGAGIAAIIKHCFGAAA